MTPFHLPSIRSRVASTAQPGRAGKSRRFIRCFSNSIQTGTISPNLQYLPSLRQRDNYAEGYRQQRETVSMKAVGYKKSLPIETAEALIDFETAKPDARGHDIRVAVKAISANPV